MSDLTRVLNSIDDRDPQGAGELLSMVYDELRKLAAVRVAQEFRGQTLQARPRPARDEPFESRRELRAPSAEVLAVRDEEDAE